MRGNKTLTISVGISILFVLIGVIIPERLADAMNASQTFVLVNFGWFYQLIATFFLIFAIIMIVGPFGKIKLGKPEDKPEYNRATWIAMLFSAGMGIGLLFYGVAEPVSHFATPPFGEGSTEESAVLGLRYTILHWGLHAWAIYAIVALALAYFKFNRGSPGLMSATLTPVIGEKRAKGGIGIAVDVIAVFATLFGVAASLGLGSQQINSGLQYLIGIPYNFGIQLTIMVIITTLFILSASTGISKGIKWLSNINMSLAMILLVAMLILGPTVFVLNLFVNTLGEYIQNLHRMGLRLSPFNEEEAGWTQGWTIFYWAWWISWTPFVGMFIARVSKGRTVREFTVAVLLIPTALCAFWFTVFGGTGIQMELLNGIDISSQPIETALFMVYDQLPLGAVLSLISVLLISTFFITSADSATFVLGMQTTGGMLNPPNRVKITWGLILSASTLVLLFSGGLDALQTAIIVSALPLTFILLVMAYSLLKSFKQELRAGRTAQPRRKEKISS
ncbi:glycine betaine uptake BCCT transporter [Jeotgalibacillus proteolyticus]|uniref:Glycine/betaine ABC transporter permease n=1 Tax=Jeotgalibacillus proteolyticus TaxID=2082395 RepID=A0A2S5G7Y4_9BACL|nr:BCCT family transporter [Jeotgalibacillus proteolyticus]PPA69102.1 glycine/betaine ABC transporter permease [Jeotgalibacillus proteolyticus]